MTNGQDRTTVDSTETRAEGESDDTGVNPQESIPFRPPRRPLNCDSYQSAFPPWYR